MLALALAGCSDGDERHPEAIAVVGDSTISLAEVTKGVREGEKPYASARRAKATPYYRPPNYATCVESLSVDGQSIGALRAQCRNQHLGLRRAVLGQLIESEWVEQGAEQRGIRLASEVPVHRITRLRERILRSATERHPSTPSASAVERYYSEHQDHFVQPASRDVIGFAAASRASAARAVEELDAGRGWDDVARRYALARAADRFQAVPFATMDAQLRRQAFDARRGAVVGPFRTAGKAYYVLSVQRIHPRFRMSLEQAREAITDHLSAAMKRKARLAFWRRFRERARAHTRCTTALEVPACGNAPRTGFEPYGVLQDPVPDIVPLPTPNDVIRGER